MERIASIASFPPLLLIHSVIFIFINVRIVMASTASVCFEENDSTERASFERSSAHFRSRFRRKFAGNENSLNDIGGGKNNMISSHPIFSGWSARIQSKENIVSIRSPEQGKLMCHAANEFLIPWQASCLLGEYPTAEPNFSLRLLYNIEFAILKTPKGEK